MNDDLTEAQQAAVDEFPDFSWHAVPPTMLAIIRDAFVRGWAAHDAALLAAQPVTAIDREALAKALCRIQHEDRSIEELVAPSVELWQRFLPEADALLASGVIKQR